MRDLDQDARCQPRIEVGALHAGPVGAEGTAGAAGAGVFIAQRLHFRGQRFFQTLGAGREDLEHLGLAGLARTAATGVKVGLVAGFGGVFDLVVAVRLGANSGAGPSSSNGS